MRKNIQNTMLAAGMAIIVLLLAACGSHPSQIAAPPSASYVATELRVLDTLSLSSTSFSIKTLSSDGSRLLLSGLVDGEEEWCIYTLDGVALDEVTPEKEFCLYPDEEFDLEAKFVDWDNAVWSPDGSRLAFTELAGRETDLWVLDVSSGQLENLTDDGISGYVVPVVQDNPEVEFSLDFHPAWAADGKSLFFTRSRYRNGEWEEATISRVSVRGGKPKTLLTVSETPDAVRGLIRFGANNRLVYLVSDPDPDNSGFWMTEKNGTSPQRIVHTGDEQGFLLQQVSPDGKQALVLDVQHLDLIIVDLSTGETHRLEGHAATFSPDGGKILYRAGNTLLVRDIAGGDENALHTLTGRVRGSPLQWANNDILRVGDSLLIHLGGEE